MKTCVEAREAKKWSVAIVAFLMMAGCASTPSQPIENEASESSTVSSMTDVEMEQIEQPTLPLSAELVYYVLTAEVAGQRGQIGVAADLYNKAAEIVESPRLAGRATQVANFTRNQERINKALKRWIEVDPSDADVYIMQAPFLMLENDFDGLVTSINKATALSPESTGTYLNQVADNLIELVQADQAIDVLTKLTAYQIKSPEAYFALARVAAYFKQYELAYEHISDVVAAQPDKEDVAILYANILQDMGKGEQALEFIAPKAKQTEATIELRFAYAKLLGENRKIEQARTVFESISLEQPNNEEALFALGLLALEERDGEAAKNYFSRLVNMGDPGKQAAYFMGLAEEQNNNLDSALIWFASVPADSQRFHAAQTRYINLLADNGEIDKARLHLKLLRKENPDRAKQFYSFEATFLRDRGELEAAFDLYKEALQAYPNDFELLYGRAMTADALDRIDVLEQDLRTILEADPNNASALNALGYTLADKTDRYQEALELIQKALVISPNDAFYLDSLGWVYYRMGKLEAAADYLKQAIAVKADPEFIAHLGEVMWHQNKQEAATSLWKKALEAHPDNKLLNDTINRFLK
jgi:tetratricopeptide (TPR) repeat protein